MTSDLYFAYGSNLNRGDWARWCNKRGYSPDLLKFRSIAFLPDHDVCFTRYSKSREGGVLDIKPRTGQIVPGVVFEVLDDGWRQLDEKEGVKGNCYRRVPAIVIDDKGREVPVQTYEVNHSGPKPFVAPHPNYVEVVRDGLMDEEFDLPTRAVDAASRNEPAPWLVDAVFVYGTLMRGESRFPVLQSYGLKCALLAQVFGRLVDLCDYPGLVDLNVEGSMVKGDFIRVRMLDKAIAQLDQIEGFRGFGRTDSLYRRTLTDVDVGNGRLRRAWTYCLVAAGDEADVIASGDWREHQGSRAEFLANLARIHSQGDEGRMAAIIAGKMPFAFNPDTESVVRSLLPLQSALAEGLISERTLAQESGNWTAG